jgi:hypothetical protein
MLFFHVAEAFGSLAVAVCRAVFRFFYLPERSYRASEGLCYEFFLLESLFRKFFAPARNRSRKNKSKVL